MVMSEEEVKAGEAGTEQDTEVLLEEFERVSKMDGRGVGHRKGKGLVREKRYTGRKLSRERVSEDLRKVVSTVKEVERRLSFGDKIEELKAKINEKLGYGDIRGALSLAAPVAFLEMFNVLLETNDLKLKKDTARDLLWMEGYKPMERQVSVYANINQMSDRELRVLVTSELNRLPEAEKREIMGLLSGGQTNGDTGFIDSGGAVIIGKQGGEGSEEDRRVSAEPGAGAVSQESGEDEIADGRESVLSGDDDSKEGGEEIDND